MIRPLSIERDLSFAVSPPTYSPSVKTLDPKWRRLEESRTNGEKETELALRGLDHRRTSGCRRLSIRDLGRLTRIAAPAPSRVTPSDSASEPLNKPRYVNVASLNVRHTPSASGPLIMALPRGTPMKVLDRKDGWLLIDLSPTLEGWVTERFTTVQAPQQDYVPPAPLVSSR